MRINTDSRLPGGAKPTVEWLESFKWAIGKRLSEIAIQLNGVTEGRLSAISNAYTAAPTTGTWAQGDYVRHSAPVEAGTAGSKYVIVGFVCTVSGTPGTWSSMQVSDRELIMIGQFGALQNPPKFGGIGNTIGRRTVFDPKTQGDSYTLGGNTYKIGGTGYGTKVYQQSGDTWIPVTGNGTAPASLQLSAAIKDPRLASWLSKDDPSIKYDDLIRSTWAKDPTQALAVYGQQAARKPGGVDPTPDSAWFTDENYWPSVMAGFDGSMPALTQSVKELGTATPQNVAALNQWRSDMSPGAQHNRNDPDKGLFGGGLLGALAPVALGFALGPAGLGLSGIGGGALAGGLTSAISGGDILKGAVLGGLGGGISNYANANFSPLASEGFAGISPAQLASTVGKTGINILGGASPTQALTGGLSSLAGTSAASNFDNPWLKNLAGTTASTAVRGGDVGNAAIGSLLGTTAKFGASQIDNPWLKQLALSSPQILNKAINAPQAPQMRQPQPQPQQAQMPDWVRQAMAALTKKGYSQQQAMQLIQQRGRG